MNYYNEIKNKLINNEIYGRVKDYSKERYRLETYFDVGKLLNAAGKHYGENIVGQYSKKLMNEVGKIYNKKMLFKMRQLYMLVSNEKVVPLVRQLSWSHCLILLPIKNIDEINYYINQVCEKHLTKRQLQDLVKLNEYERLSIETRNKIIKEEKLEVKDVIPNPIIINNKKNIEIITEKVLHQLILEDISLFMEELGTGYSFIKSEYKIKIGDRYNYIDLLLFNIEFNCYVVIELKVTELKKEHIGQIETYMNYIDKNIKKITQDKTIGIIICKKDNKFIMEYISDNRILTRAYELI